ncbi:MAG: WGR domain-containing protein [Proteobacteria bacterium]|jgi:predicted DNA-binding WGR domain protein|nr:WGR domain-containing protein [Pseudomonadota bacterium]
MRQRFETLSRFFEVEAQGMIVCVRYGRLGEQGYTTLWSVSSPEIAKDDARQKAHVKMKTGWTPVPVGRR